MNEHGVSILVVDDDEDDRMLAERAFRTAKLSNPRVFAKDGIEAMDYLYQRGPYDATSAPRPGLILLDLNMPRMDGREVLAEIKKDPDLRMIPVVVLTTSSAEEDILRSYQLGGSSFIRKPVSFAQLVEVVTTLGRYWFNTVHLPPALDPL